MKFKLLNSTRIVDIKINKYLIDWDAKIKRGKHFGQFQFDVKQLVRPYWEREVVLEEFKLPAKSGERGRSLDLVNLTRRQILEIDGDQHNQQSWMHRNKYQFFKQLRNDLWKENWAEINGFEFFRILESDELNEELLKKLNIIS